MQTAFSATDTASRWEPIKLPGASVWLRRRFLPERAATLLLDQLIADVPWRRDTIRMFGKTHALPRLQQWYGEPGRVYVWSGIEMHPLAWTPLLANVCDKVQRATRHEFDSVLLNYYRDGNDSVGWHADDEPELGPSPFIASLSLGAERDFVLRQVDGERGRASIVLEHGSLLVMAGDTQANWQHALPRRKRVSGARVNLTFRAFA